MNETQFSQFERLIAERTGLHLRPRERDALLGTVATRKAALRLPNADAYRELLEADTLDAEREWEQLTVRLTNNESYFFRDKGQMALLRERILPELIARNRELRSLRIWSAGCSTGEEAYSLAILVAGLLPQHRAGLGGEWEIVILGTDIDGEALQAARRGSYSAWSFRTMEAGQQQRWFHRQGSGWQIDEQTRALVTFRRCNLVVDSFPNKALGIDAMDLILCRNVFIYFAPTAVSTVLPKFAATLRDGGYLMTGHAETLGQLVEPLVMRQFPESVVYQRVGQDSARVGKPNVAEPTRSTLVPTSTPTRPPAEAKRRDESPILHPAMVASAPPATSIAQTDPLDSAMADAESRYAAGDYEGTIQRLQALPAPVSARALMLLAHAQANLGHTPASIECCRKVTRAFPFLADPYELLAFLAQEEGRYDDAKGLLKQAQYLAPSAPTSYLELAALYDREDDRERARKMRITALEILERLPAETVVGFSGGPTAQEWRLHLQRRLAEGA